MTVWESKTSKDVLIAINGLGTIICENLNAGKFSYETHYFQAQLLHVKYGVLTTKPHF